MTGVSQFRLGRRKMVEDSLIVSCTFCLIRKVEFG